MSLAQAANRMLATFGTVYTLRKPGLGAGANAWTGGASVPVYVACRGRERHAKPDGIRGGMVEVGSLIVIDAATCPTTPQTGDRIALGTFAGDAGADWKQIVNVYGAREGAAVRVWRIEVAK